MRDWLVFCNMGRIGVQILINYQFQYGIRIRTFKSLHSYVCVKGILADQYCLRGAARKKQFTFRHCPKQP